VIALPSRESKGGEIPESQLTPAEADPAHDDWRELASRAGDGLEIALLWSKSTKRVRLTVLDERLDESFDVEVDGADALTAFQHPCAYVGSRIVTNNYAGRHLLTPRQQV
jgi:hypothetical protein